MKWFRRFFILILFLAVCVIAVILFLPFSNNFQQKGELNIPGLQNRVTIQRDANGMAYIKAQNLDDVLFAQGFVTAQDRLPHYFKRGYLFSDNSGSCVLVAFSLLWYSVLCCYSKGAAYYFWKFFSTAGIKTFSFWQPQFQTVNCKDEISSPWF